MTDTSKEAVENLILFHGLEDGLGDVADTLRAFQAELDEAKAEIERRHSAQSYTYIGKDGKSVQARVLEDERDALKAENDQLRDLMALAHASMRACGWHLALASDVEGDGVLQAAVAEIEEKFRKALKGSSQ